MEIRDSEGVGESEEGLPLLGTDFECAREICRQFFSQDQAMLFHGKNTASDIQQVSFIAVPTLPRKTST